MRQGRQRLPLPFRSLTGLACGMSDTNTTGAGSPSRLWVPLAVTINLVMSGGETVQDHAVVVLRRAGAVGPVRPGWQVASVPLFTVPPVDPAPGLVLTCGPVRGLLLQAGAVSLWEDPRFDSQGWLSTTVRGSGAFV